MSKRKKKTKKKTVKKAIKKTWENVEKCAGNVRKTGVESVEGRQGGKFPGNFPDIF